MSSSLPSEEIAMAFKDALQDLQMNVRWEINNLTMIAKENIEHAMAISRTLEQHIKTTTPERKLPALYVLDSIVKNVGTPYTLYLGRNLYNTFMGSYTLVDGQTRRAMESMLKTWKEPVPGSIDPKPVFSVDDTRPIESALIKARTVFVQHQNLSRNQGYQQSQQLAANRQFHALPPRPAVAANGGPMMRETRSPSLTPNFQAPPQPAPPYHTPSTPINGFNGGYTQSQPSLDRLHQDVDVLISSTRDESTTRPFDPNLQKRLKALLDLKAVLETQQLPVEQLMLVKTQLDSLQLASRRSPAPEISQPPQNYGRHMSAAMSTYPTMAPTPPNATFRPQSAAPQLPPPPQAPLPGMDLAALLAGASSAAAPPPAPANTSAFPNLAAMLGQVQQDSHTGSAPLQSNSLLDSLRTAGLLTGNNPPSRPTSASIQQPAFFPPSLRSLVATPPIPAASAGRTVLGELKNEVQLTTASLRTPRPQLVGSLFSALPSQCSTCGRRFPGTPDGREAKARHLDSHFRTNRRLADSATRTGSSRSWFPSELEWIRYREVYEGDDAGGSDGKDGKASGSQGMKGSAIDVKAKFVKAPADASVAGHACPICQEKFETVWHDDAQEWVWMDAEVVGGRAYHASCRAEIKDDAVKSSLQLSSTQQSAQVSRKESATPDSILGKRKAEFGSGADEDQSTEGAVKMQKRAGVV